MAGSPPVKVIACCWSSCLEGAICRVFTKTGWANVCRTHYPKIELSDKSYAGDSLVMKEIREAYHESYTYKRFKAGDMPAGLIGNLIPSATARKHGEDPTREPGQDEEELPLGIGRDPLEQEFMDKANP